MNWLEYFEQQKTINDHEINELPLRVFGDDCKFPQIAKYISLLCDMVGKVGVNKILFIMPNISDLSVYFSLFRSLKMLWSEEKSIHEIFSEFKSGDKIRYDKAVAEFIGFERNMPCIQFSDLKYFVKPDAAPFFQKTDKDNKISKFNKFKDCMERRKLQAIVSDKGNFLSKIADMKGSRDKSIQCIFPNKLTQLRKYIKETDVDVFNLQRDLCYVIDNKVAAENAQLSPDLYISGDFDFNKISTCKEYIVDCSSCNIDDQWYYFRPLLDDENRFYCFIGGDDDANIETFKEEGFEVFRLDRNTIPCISGDVYNIVDDKVQNCFNKNISYEFCDDVVLSSLNKAIKRVKKDIEDESVSIQTIYAHIRNQILLMRNKLYYFPNTEREENIIKIDAFKKQLMDMKFFIGKSETYNILLSCLNALREVYQNNLNWNKQQKLACIIRESTADNICLVVPPKVSFEEYKEFKRLAEFDTRKHIELLEMGEFCKTIEDAFYDLVIVPAWLYEDNMKQILASYKSANFKIIMYPFEKNWMVATTKKWERVLTYENEISLIGKIEGELVLDINQKYFTSNLFEVPDSLDDENIDGVEREITDIRIKRYQGNRFDGEEQYSAIPLSFSGGYIAFYLPEHKLVSVTNILSNKSSSSVEAKHLGVGDIIALRDSGKDLIREVADRILESRKLGHIRKEVEVWRGMLKEFMISNSAEVVLKLMRNSNIDIHYVTLANWLKNEQMIIPKLENTFLTLGSIIDNSFNREYWLSIFDLGKKIRSAHITAGRALSDELHKNLAKAMTEQGVNIKNAFFPIELNIENMGIIKMHKINSVGKQDMFPESLINTVKKEM